MNTRFIFNIFSFAPARIIPAITGFLSVVIFTRLLSIEEYGQFVLVYTAVSFLSTLGFSWLFQSVLRYHELWSLSNRTAEFYTTVNDILKKLMIVIISFSFLFTAVLRYSHYPQWSWLVLSGGLLGAFKGSYATSLKLAQSRQQAALYNIYVLISEVGGIILSLLFIKYLGVPGILLGMCISSIIVLIFDQKHFRIHTQGQPFKPSSELRRTLIKYGLPTVSFSISVWVLAFIDRYLIGIMRNELEVGVYGSIYTLSSQSIGIVFRIIMLAAYPAIVKQWETNDIQKTKVITSRYLGLYAILAFPIIATVSYFKDPLTHVILPDGYSFGIAYVPWIVLGVAFHGLSEYFAIPILLKEKTRTLALLTIISSFVNIFLNILLIPHLGALAAALNTFISYLILSLLFLYYSRSHWRWLIPWKDLIPGLMGFLVMFPIWHFLSLISNNYRYLDLAVNVCVGLSAYGSILYLTKRYFYKDKIKNE